MDRKSLTKRIGAMMLVLPLLGAASPQTLKIEVSGLRSPDGQISLCLFNTPEHFPDCNRNGEAIKRTVPAQEGATIMVEGLASGSYAVSLIHDENGNGKLDSKLGIPSEGVGFSRNPKFLFGPPSFKSAQFETGEMAATETIRVRYFL